MEPITSTISNIFELLLKLLQVRNKRRREIFTDILQPIFERLEQVNLFYRKLFLDSIKALPSDGASGAWEISEVKRRLIERREEGSEIRDQLRIYATELLKAVEGKKEKRFLVTVMFYFLEESSGLEDDSDCDWWIDEIEKVGGKIALRTPARYASAYIERKTDAAELKKAFEGVLKALERKLQNVNRAFIALKLDVLSKT